LLVTTILFPIMREVIIDIVQQFYDLKVKVFLIFISVSKMVH
jgi:hypothetical protein